MYYSGDSGYRLCRYLHEERKIQLPFPLHVLTLDWSQVWDWGGVEGTQSHSLIALLSPGPCEARHQDNVQDLVSFVCISSVLMGKA
jgi:hypothetical protein